MQAISARLWSSGYLPGEHAGVSFRSGGDPILYINNPPGVPPQVRRNTLDGLESFNEMNYQLGRRSGDAHAHRAIRAGLPHAGQRARADRASRASRLRPIALYGDEASKPGTFANTRAAGPADGRARRALRADLPQQLGHARQRRPAGCPSQCRDVDQPCWGLIQDLKARGLLDETLVIWGGEFGRTIYSQGGLTPAELRPRPSSRAASRCGWPAAASRPGTIYGETDDFSYNIVKDPVHIRDFHATVLQLLGFDHQRFTFRYQGLDQRLTGVEPARVIKELHGVIERPISGRSHLLRRTLPAVV